MDNMLNCFVRMKTRTESRKVEKSPAVGSRIKLHTNKQLGFKPHLIPQKPNEFHYGILVDNEFGCVQTRTDFSIWLTKNSTLGDLPTHEDLKDLPDQKLTSAYIEVIVDTRAAARDLEGAISLADPEFEPETLSTLREVIMGEPSAMQHNMVHLCTDQPEAWEDHVKTTEAIYGDNKEQKQCISSLANMQDKLVAVSGPPRTGKTWSFAKTLIGGLTQIYKVLTAALLHISVDGAANKVWEELPNKYKSGPEEKFLMRLKTKGAELRAFLTIKNYKSLNREDLDPTKRPEYMEILEEDAVKLAKAIAESISDLVENEKELRKI